MTFKMKTQIEIKQMSDDELIREVAETFGHATKFLHYLAKLYAEMNVRRLDVSHCKGGLWDAAKAIVHDGLVPEAAARLHGAPAKMKAVAKLPKQAQREVATGEKYKVVEMDPDAPNGTRIVDKSVNEMSVAQVEVVFGSGAIRTVKEQASLLRGITANLPPRSPPVAMGQGTRSNRSGKLEIKAKLDTGEIVVGMYTIKPADLGQALHDLGFEPLRRKVRAKVDA